MATQCTFCGSPLKADARYCNHCGTLAASHPFSPKSSSTLAPPVDESHNTNEASNEPPAQPPPARTSRRLTQDEPPSWMSQLENGLQSKVPSNTQLRELRVQVWKQEQHNNPEESNVNGRNTDDVLEDLPTGPLVEGSPEFPTQRNAHPSIPDKVHSARSEEVEFLDTVPLVTQMGTKPQNTPLPSVEINQRQARFSQQQVDAANRAKHQNFSAPSPEYLHQESRMAEQRPVVFPVPPANGWRETPPSQSAVPSDPTAQRTKRRKGRKLPLIMLVIVLVVSAVVGAWMIVYHPFSVPAITQPQQSFSNTQLGFSLDYPNGWQSQVDMSKTTVHFNDTSHTAQVNIIVSSAPAGNLGSYLQQEANQLGLTSLQSSSTSFGGASWQKIRGNVLLRGASYTETLLATIHKDNVFTILLLAPQTTYAQEEALIFSKMYASFRFLS